MVEGHKGSLVCARCLSAAWAVVSAGGGGAGAVGGVGADRCACTMCLEQRSGPRWESPLFAEAVICLRCVKQAARTLEKDPESGWRRPGAPGDSVGGDGNDDEE